jgi:phenylalanyl-tRNA synthetase alpha chain
MWAGLSICQPMKEALQAIVDEVLQETPGLQSRAAFEQYKATITGPNGSLTATMKGMKDVPKQDRPAAGKLINEAKQQIEAAYQAVIERVEAAEIAQRLGPEIDPTLPVVDTVGGSLHPLTQVRRQLEACFGKIGFTVAEGPEVETEWTCFDALNTPDDHPARDEQDTLFFPESAQVETTSRRSTERYLLRSHTSTVQIRTLLSEPLPLRIIAPGRVFRRDTADATHSPNFHQCEGLYVDHQVSVCDLKAVLDFFVTEVFGSGAQVRLRPSFFPFTEPSFELDFKSPDLGKLSGKWIEIGGCGMVDPAVLSACEIDPSVYSGYAFGMGIERIAMILYGIDDIRHFYANDLRFLRMFA